MANTFDIFQSNLYSGAWGYVTLSITKLFNGRRVPVEEDENILGMDDGGGCTTS